MRQILADKVTGEALGLWLLVPEHLRLGTWDLLRGWTEEDGARVEPRLAMQLVHEAALCSTGIRHQRRLPQPGFELLNGLPFLATDWAVHNLLAARTVADGQRLQIALGKIRRTLGHFGGRVLAIDPHRVHSYSKRRMRKHRKDDRTRALKVGQTCFTLDADTAQPVCFAINTAARTATQAALEQMAMTAQILGPFDPVVAKPLIVADLEHFTAELFDTAVDSSFDLLTPMPRRRDMEEKLERIAAEQFQRHWVGYATAPAQPYHFAHSRRGPFHRIVQRLGERPEDYWLKAFLSTTDNDQVRALTEQFPKRWHIEEFFNFEQALGWNRAGTMNLNIRYGKMTMALLAQAALHELRKRLGEPWSRWDAAHFAKGILEELNGTVRVREQTIEVTYYNAPDAERLRAVYEDLPRKLQARGIDPRIPWLYDFQLDFRFR